MNRKFICFLLIITAFNMPLSAQFSKGMRMAGASIGTMFFNSGKYTYTVPLPTTGYTESTNSIGLSLTPGFGWFISGQTVIGAQLQAGYRYDKNIKADENNVTFLRNYFTSSGKFLPFGQVSLLAGIGSASHQGFDYSLTPLFKDDFDGESSGDFYANAGITIGLTKMLNPHVGLDITAGYLYSYNKQEYKTIVKRDVDIDGSIDETATSQLTTKYTNHGFTIGVGFQVFFGGK
jgi:opacity protein-like surface antigen